MSEPAQSTHRDHWLATALDKTWRGSRPGRVVPLKGDASTRRFWRVEIAGAARAPASAILADLGPDDLPLYASALKLYREPLEEPPWLNVHRFLESIGAPVAALYVAAPRERLLLIEDLGEDSLSAAAAANPRQAAELYRAAIDELLRPPRRRDRAARRRLRRVRSRLRSAALRMGTGAVHRGRPARSRARRRSRAA